MTDAVHHIPLAAIDEAAVSRDRTRLETDKLEELVASIVRTGLRQPIEVFELAEPQGARVYGLISGFRRLRAFRDIVSWGGDAALRFAEIPAFLRRPDDIPAVLAAMVEENDVRANLSAWERGAVAARAVREGWFSDLHTAVAALYPNANRHKRGRLRVVAELAHEMDGILAEPERLSERDCLRYADAVACGFADHIVASLEGALARGHDAQWAIIESILTEAKTFPEEHPIREGRPNRRRIVRHRRIHSQAVAIRREHTRDGFVLHVTGPGATTTLINSVFDEVERWLSPG